MARKMILAFLTLALFAVVSPISHAQGPCVGACFTPPPTSCAGGGHPAKFTGQTAAIMGDNGAYAMATIPAVSGCNLSITSISASVSSTSALHSVRFVVVEQPTSTNCNSGNIVKNNGSNWLWAHDLALATGSGENVDRVILPPGNYALGQTNGAYPFCVGFLTNNTGDNEVFYATYQYQ